MKSKETFFFILAICIILILYICKELETVDFITKSKLIESTSRKDTNSQTIREYENLPQKQHFGRENPFNRTWCPSAKCYNSPLCLPCNRRFLFIIATGRSGSTTLLRMFDQLPNVRLSGENYNILFQTSELLKTIQDHPMHYISNDTIAEGYFMHETVKEGPFKHNAIPIGSFSCVIQHLFRTLNPPPIIVNKTDHKITPHAFIDKENEERKILGMKGIRLQNQDLLSWTPTEAATFLKDNFPCSRYIINIDSNYINQSKAMKKYLKDKTKDLQRNEIQENIKHENDFLTELNSLLGDDAAQLLDFAKWQQNVSILNNVVDWLGFQNCSFNTLVHENHHGFGHDNTTEIRIGETCMYPHI